MSRYTHMRMVSCLCLFFFFLILFGSSCEQLQPFEFCKNLLTLLFSVLVCNGTNVVSDCFFRQLYLAVLWSFSSAVDLYYINHLQREKKNLQDLNGVFVFNVADREFLDRPTARLIKEFDNIEGKVRYNEFEYLADTWSNFILFVS